MRRREHPTTIFQSPLLPDRHKSSCLYAVQLKSWYDEQYNDWAKRHLRERLYNRYGIDRGAEYVYRNLDLKPKSAKKLAPTKVLADEEYPITECKQSIHNTRRLPLTLSSVILWLKAGRRSRNV